jgi:hypothetical protein
MLYGYITSHISYATGHISICQGNESLSIRALGMGSEPPGYVRLYKVSKQAASVKQTLNNYAIG